MSDPPAWNATELPERLECSAPDAVEKYRHEIVSGYWASAGTLLVGPILIATMEAFGVDASLEFMQSPTGYTAIILASLALSVVTYRHTIVAGRRERALVEAHPGEPALVLTRDFVECSIALMEGKPRAELLKAERAVFSTPWGQIARWVVDPSRSAGESTSPPYFILELKSGEKVWILREHFAGRESEIVEFARSQLAGAVVLNDELR
jgi:hypothetical protein